MKAAHDTSPAPTDKVPTATSLRREILRGSWFFGIPPMAWGLLVGTIVYGASHMLGFQGPSVATVSLLGAWGLSEAAFLKRRLEAKSLAEYQRRQEIARRAMKNGVQLRDLM